MRETAHYVLLVGVELKSPPKPLRHARNRRRPRRPLTIVNGKPGERRRIYSFEKEEKNQEEQREGSVSERDSLV